MTPTEIEQARDALSALSSQLGQGLGDGNEPILSMVERVRQGVEMLVLVHGRAMADLSNKLLETKTERGCGDCPRGPGGGLRDTFSVECGECRRFYGDSRQPAAKPL